MPAKRNQSGFELEAGVMDAKRPPRSELSRRLPILRLQKRTLTPMTAFGAKRRAPDEEPDLDHA